MVSTTSNYHIYPSTKRKIDSPNILEFHYKEKWVQAQQLACRRP